MKSVNEPCTAETPRERLIKCEFIVAGLLILSAPLAHGQTRIAFLPENQLQTANEDSGDSVSQPWLDMDYGQSISATFEIRSDNYAKKGIATRLDPGRGGFSKGRDYLIFDTDTLRCAAAWRGRGGIDWRGIALNGDMEAQPSIAGHLLFENPDAPGWGAAGSSTFADTRYVGRDGARYGPFDRSQGRWLGRYQYNDHVVWSYDVLGARVLESPSGSDFESAPVIMRHFEIGARPTDMVLQVAHDSSGNVERHGDASIPVTEQVVTFNAPGMRGSVSPSLAARPRRSRRELVADDRGFAADVEDKQDIKEEAEDENANEEDADGLRFSGDTSLRIAQKRDFNLTTADYTIIAKVRTEEGGTIFAQAPREGEHAPNTKSLFVAGGVLQFDIGWVDVVSGSQEVDDGRWHVVAVTFANQSGDTRLYVDGQEEAHTQMRPTAAVDQEQVLRIGFTTPDFPDEVRGFEGHMADVAFYQRVLGSEELRQFAEGRAPEESLVAHWNRFDDDADQLVDATGHGHDARLEEVDIEDAGLDDEDEEFEEEREASKALRFDGRSLRVALKDLRAATAQRRSYTIAARIRTEEGGPIFAISANDGSWQPNNICWFVRNGRLVFDLGFVGQVQGWKNVADGRWHDVAMTYDRDTGKVGFIVDGQDDQVRSLEGNVDSYALLPTTDTEEGLKLTTGWIGYASEEFPEEAPKYFAGQIARLRIYADVLPAEDIENVMSMEPAESLGVLAAWVPALAVDGLVEDFSENGLDGLVLGSPSPDTASRPVYQRTACGIIGAPAGTSWRVTPEGHVRLLIPAGDRQIRFSVVYAPLVESLSLETFRTRVLSELTIPQSLTAMCHGSDRVWDEEVLTKATSTGPNDAPYVVEEIDVPSENPYHSRMQLCGLDFFESSRSAAVCTLPGDVWVVDGLDNSEADNYSWRRIATGLFQPLGLKIVDGDVYVTGRDQITRLRDLNGDGETDFYECFNNDAQVTPHFGEFATGLEVDTAGCFYYAKGARRGLGAVVPQHGTLLRVSPDGSATEVVANGFRAPSGICVQGNGTFFVTDLEGQWMPKNRINLVREGRFYGNQLSYIQGETAEDFELPMVWVHGQYDQAPADVLEVTSNRWGPLEGHLLCLSNSSGTIHAVLQQKEGNTIQGGLFRLPIPTLNTAVGYGRFNPRDGQLYTCGFIDRSSGDHRTSGGLYRIRYTGRPVTVPVRLVATKDGIEVTFSGPLDPQSATDWRNYAAARWGYRRSLQFGSEDYRLSDPRRRGRDRLLAQNVRISDDNTTVTIAFSEMQTAPQMELKFNIQSATGESLDYTIHQTIHDLGAE